MAGQICNFSLDATGKLFVSTGFRKIREWDGVQANDWDAGISAPNGLMHCTPSGGGNIVGTLYAMYRFLDQFNQPSDLVFGDSSTNPIPISSESGAVVGASNTSLIVIQSGTATNLPTDPASVSVGTVSALPQVSVSGVQGNTAANGNWYVISGNGPSGANLAWLGFPNITIPQDGLHFALYFAAPYNPAAATVSAGNGAYASGGAWTSGVAQIQYSEIQQSDPRAVQVQICRSKDGDASTFYVDIQTALPCGAPVSTNTDSQLGTAVPLFDQNNNDLAIARFGEPPFDKPQMVQMASRFVAFGYPVWNQGKVAVTHGSPTVTCQNCGLTADMQFVGRTLTVQGAANEYTIQSFNAASTPQTITLTGNYLDSSNISATYAILPDTGAGRRTFDFGDPVYSAAFNPLDSLAVPEDAAAGQSIGIIVLDRIAYLFAEFRAWRLSFQQSPSVDGAQALGSQRGILNSRCAIAVEDSVYIMDRQGVYLLQYGQVSPLSVPIHDLFDTQRPQTATINFRWSQYFHGVHDPEREVVKWFVSMDGRYPRHALCYHYRFQRWWVEQWNFAIGSSALGYVAGRPVVFLGAEGRNIFAADTGLADGVANAGAYTLQGSVTSAGLTWFASNGAAFNPAWPGSCVSVDIVSGTGAGQRRRLTNIDASTATKYWIDQPWSVMPDTSSVFQIGGVAWNFTSGIYRFAEGNAQQPQDGGSPRKVELVFQPTTGNSNIVGQMFYNHDTTPDVFEQTRIASDTNGVTVTAGSPNIQIQAGPIVKPDGSTFKNQGRVQLPMTGSKDTRSGGREFLSVQLSGVTNNEKHKLYQLSLKGLTP